MNKQEQLQELLGLGSLNKLPRHERRIIEGWLFAFEGNEDKLFQRIERFSDWYLNKTGQWPNSIHLYKKSIEKLEGEMLQDGRILVRRLARKFRA